MAANDDHIRAEALAARTTVAVITALPKEMVAMKKMLDGCVSYSTPGKAPGEYVLGEIPAKGGGTHAVVLACSWMGENLAAANVAIVLERLPSVSNVLMVGIAGAVPDPEKLDHDVRLGDIVVSDHNGVIQYDHDKEVLRDGVVERLPRHPPRPSGARLLTADRDLQVAELEGHRSWEAHFARAHGLEWARRPTHIDDDDVLHRSNNPKEVVGRAARSTGEPRVFRGPIASANKLLKNARLRDRLRDTFGVKAAEMEGAGVADSAWLNAVGYLVVRGTCDYCDEHKADRWQGYAAMISAAYARALLEQMRTADPGPTVDRSAQGDTIQGPVAVVHNHAPVTTQVIVNGPAMFAGAPSAVPESVLWHDFGSYIGRILQDGVPSLLPSPLQTALNGDVEPLLPEALHVFRHFEKDGSNPPLQFSEVFNTQDSAPIILVGESGIGKSSLLAQLRFRQARAFVNGSSTVVPVLIRLRNCIPSVGILDLVQHSLSGLDGSPTTESLRALLRQGRLFLLLDAFDEVVDQSRQAVERELQMILGEYKATRAIISTRPMRVPTWAGARRYRVEDLSPERAERLLKLHLPGKHARFSNQVRDRRLERLTSNTLLLTLLVLLFRSSGSIPTGRMQILREVVESVRRIELAKDRFERDLDWDVKVRLLSCLAFRTAREGEGYSLDDSSAREALRSAVRQLEESRDMPFGVSLPEVLSNIESTGFVRREGDGVTFWHRAFLEYFAAVEVSRLLSLGRLDLADMVSRTRYATILPMALAMLPESSRELVSAAGKLNCFAAAEAVAELGGAGSNLFVEEVLPQLRKCCLSDYSQVRTAGFAALSRLAGSSVDATLADMLDVGTPDIQVSALIEMARRQMPNVRAAIDGRLEWKIFDEISLASGSEAIFRALGEIGDEDAQRTLLRMWKAASVRWPGAHASYALRTIARRGMLRSQIESELVEWFVSDQVDDNYGTVEDLAGVLKVTGSIAVARAVADRVVRTGGSRRGHGWPTSDVDVLASFDEPLVVRLIADNACNRSLPVETRLAFARALATSAGEIPFDSCIVLCTDDDCRVRAEGIDAAVRFPFAWIEEHVLRAMLDVSHRDVSASRRGHERLQSACIKLLARHGQLRLLLLEGNSPRLMYRIPLELLMSFMGAQRMRDLVPLVSRFISRDMDTRFLACAALALGEVGELTFAREVFEHILAAPNRELYTESELIRGAHRLPPDEAIRWIDRTWSMNGHDRRTMSAYMSGVYIEALEKVGTEQARQRLMALLEREASEEEHDRLDEFRALYEIATSEMEGWLVALYESDRFSGRYERGWILSMLGKVGSDRILKVLAQGMNAADSWQRNVAFRASQEIWHRMGYVWFNGEERLAGAGA
ncbi:phosphorylase family protein [Polyangium mundeleinium]|uniref:NACHT domain-containing protein n=1 Tax=Polyangium mundeleinium TaxID=2995306 RepID=A0ABT5F6G1_9BACT|nr:NACHT domain-containing protein [Polyangium mundeleinium]MDC0748676.1 NACHT domain-containing protein [Polyangium mundeleinium]